MTAYVVVRRKAQAARDRTRASRGSYSVSALRRVLRYEHRDLVLIWIVLAVEWVWLWR